MPPPHRTETLSDDARLTSVWRLSVGYIGLKSRAERPRKTKIGTEVGHVTRDSDTTFEVERSKVFDLLQGVGHIVAASRTACCYCIAVTLYKSVTSLTNQSTNRMYLY